MTAAVQRSDALHPRLAQARATTDALWKILRPGALLERPIPDRHRLLFYLGHLEAFDWNLICRRGFDEPSFHPPFDQLFEFGIDPAPGPLPQDSTSDWPSEAEVRQYNSRARNIIDHRLAYAPRPIVEAAIEHRLMHAETLAYLFHNLPHDAKLSRIHHPAAANESIDNPLVPTAAGATFLGKADDGTFGWDNEFSRHLVEVPAFQASQYKVTNGEYLEFVNAGAPPPHFWLLEQGEWLYRGMFENFPLPLNAPVYVTQQEAAAYAAWAHRSLLTEAQFHRLADLDHTKHGNHSFAHWDPIPVDQPGTSPLIGNGWEWTRTSFAPFPGFAPLDFYPVYSANFFDGQHYVLKGASPRTAACFLRPSFRNWFRPDYPYAYATFRTANFQNTEEPA